MSGDQDLYVKANGAPTLASFDCRPYSGANTTETCTVALAAPGYIGVMVNGYAGSPATATLIGHN